MTQTVSISSISVQSKTSFSESCQAVGWDAVRLAREVLSGKGEGSSGELNALQRIAAAASEPLLALGRSAGAVIFSGLGSTTAVALTSGLGILRLGVGALSSSLVRHLLLPL